VLGEADGEVLGDADTVADALGETLGLIDGEADPDGLGLACVIVIVVTPFWTVAVTSAPVVPRRNTPAMTPDFAWRNSSSRRSNMDMPPICVSNERRRRAVRR